MKPADIVDAIERVAEIINNAVNTLGPKVIKASQDAEPLAAAIVHGIAGGFTEQDKINLDNAVKSFHARIQEPLPPETEDDV